MNMIRVGHIPGKVHLVGNDDHRGLTVCQFAQHPQYLSGQLGVQRTGGLVKAEDIRVQCQRPGNGHPLLLSAGQLVRIVPRPRRQPHLLQQRPGLFFQLRMDLAAVRLVIQTLLCQQFPRQHHILQGCVLWKEVEILEYQAKAQPFFADSPPRFGQRGPTHPHHLAPHLDHTGIRPLQKVEAAQQGGLAGTRRPDDRQGFSLLQLKGDVPQHLRAAKCFADAAHF